MPMMHRNDDYTYALWRFNEPTGSIAYDEAGKHDLHLSNSNATITSGTYKSYAVSFDKFVSSSFYVNNSILNDVFTSSWTIEGIWRPSTTFKVLNTASSAGRHRFMGFSKDSETTRAAGGNVALSLGILAQTTTSCHFRGGWFYDATQYESTAADTVYPLNDYSHFAITKEVIGSNARLCFYGDGVKYQDGTGVNVNSSSCNTLYVGTAMYGTNNTINTGVPSFDGVIEELRISNTVRTKTEIEDSVFRCFNNSIHAGPPILLAADCPLVSGTYDFENNVTTIRLTFSKHMSMTTLSTSSNFTINPNTATVTSVLGGSSRTYIDLYCSNVMHDTLYYVTASTSLIDIDGNNIQSGSNVVAFRMNTRASNILLTPYVSRDRIIYHMRGYTGTNFVYWISYDNPDKLGLFAPQTGLTDIVIDNVSYEV